MIFFMKKASAFVASPAGSVAEESFEKVKPGDLIKCEYIKSRNYENLQRYMVFIEILWQNMEESIQAKFGNKDNFRHAIEFSSGAREKVFDFDTRQYVESRKSISFESMDEIAFKAIFSSIIDTALEFFKNWTKPDMLEVVENEIINFI